MTHDPIGSRRRPWAAFVLSLVQPGLGHLYAGNPKRALVVFASLTALGIGAITFVLISPGAWALGVLVLALQLLLLAAFDAALTAKAATHRYALQKLNRWYVYIGGVLIIAGVRALLPELPEAFRMPSGSMQPTLRAGDWFYVDKRTAARQDIHAGDLVVYRSPDDNSTAVKRAVGVSGDTLSMRGDTLWRNGSAITEPYVDRQRLWDDSAGTREVGSWGPVLIPIGHVFVLGDDCHASKDSRQVGPIPIASIVGRPHFSYYSVDPEGDKPLLFITAVRWHRVGHVPH